MTFFQTTIVTIGLKQQGHKLVFGALKQNMSLRTSPLKRCGNPPVLPASLYNPDSSVNLGKTGVFYYSILKIRGIGQCALWLAMTYFFFGAQ